MGLQYRNRGDGCQPVLAGLVDRLARLILPMRCLLCSEPALQANICEACFHGLPGNQDACPGCATRQTNPTGGRCAACLAKPPPWDEARAALSYSFPADTLVQALKFKHQLAAGPALARAMACAPPTLAGAGSCWLVPVPLHFSRYLRRGFNQADELAMPLARLTGLPLAGRWLYRCRRTPAQSALTARQRRDNLHGAFRWRGPALAGAQALLIDDVMTTGSTLAECSRVLRGAGAGKISVWVAARA